MNAVHDKQLSRWLLRQPAESLGDQPQYSDAHTYCAQLYPYSNLPYFVLSASQNFNLYLHP